MSAECIQEDKKFFSKFSPGCGGEVEYPSGMSTMNPKTKRFKQIPGKTCRLHHLENSFGLYALECPKCKKQDKDTFRDQIQKQTDIAMGDMEKFTYISCDVVFAPARHTWFLMRSISAFTIKCWNCSFVFFKGRKATKEERKKNDRQAWKEIPEASPKMKKMLEKAKTLEEILDEDEIDEQLTRKEVKKAIRKRPFEPL